MQIFMKTALAQAGATRNAANFQGKTAGTQAETSRSPHKMLQILKETSPKPTRDQEEPTPEPTSNAVNSHRNIAGTDKSPRGAHTGAHLKCCKFS